jgi:hypothetical protein
MNYAQCHPNKPNASRGLCDACRLKRDYSKRKAKIIAWIKANPEKRKHYWITQQLRKLGLSHNDYVVMWNAQGGVCAACNISGSRLVIDHDHRTNKVRGLLCLNCNTALGMVHDNVIALQHLIAYLTKLP